MKEKPRAASKLFRWKKKAASKNKQNTKRLCFPLSEQAEEGGCQVVKGISKRVIVVKSPDPKIFEQAIFIIREDFAGQSGMSDKDVLQEARRVAGHYLSARRTGTAGRILSSVRAPLYAAAGAAATGLAWIAVQMVRL